MAFQAVLSAAQCQTSPGCPTQRCDAAYWINALNVAAGASNAGVLQNAIYMQYTTCSTFGATSTTQCCVDPCNAWVSTDACSRDRRCIALPQSSSGSADNPCVCVLREKLCNLLPMNGGCSNPNYGFCGMSNGQCTYIDPAGASASTATLPPGGDVLSKCDSLHPMVIAMLALMFITLVGAIIIVGVIVVINQRKADREEAEREAAALRQGRR